MQSPIYFLSWTAAACLLWLFWSFGIKRLFLDIFRERLFEIRFEMFRLGISGELPFDSETYRTLETLICGLLRFAHRITFLTFLFSRIEQERAQKEKDYVDIGLQISLMISRQDSKTQARLLKILQDLKTAIYVYMAFSSLFLLSLIIVYKVARVLGLWQPGKAEKEISGVVEREAYRAESMRPFRVAVV